MSKLITGVVKDGRIELLEPLNEPDGSRVVVTLSGQPRYLNLQERGMTVEDAADLRAWLREMDVYDRY